MMHVKHPNHEILSIHSLDVQIAPSATRTLVINAVGIAAVGTTHVRLEPVQPAPDAHGLLTFKFIGTPPKPADADLGMGTIAVSAHTVWTKDAARIGAVRVKARVNALTQLALGATTQGPLVSAAATVPAIPHPIPTVPGAGETHQTSLAGGEEHLTSLPIGEESHSFLQGEFTGSSFINALMWEQGPPASAGI